MRSSLFRRYWLIASLLATLPVALLGCVEIVLSFREKAAIVSAVQRARAREVAAGVAKQLELVTKSLRDVVELPWGDDSLTSDERREEFRRLQKLRTEVDSVLVVERKGKETLFLHRMGLERIDSRRSWSAHPLLDSLRFGQLRYGVPHFRDGSEPIMAISLAASHERGGIAIAELNLQFVSDALEAALIEQTMKRPSAASTGLESAVVAYVVGPDGSLLAHPQRHHVLRKTDMTRLPHVSTAKEQSMHEGARTWSMRSIDLDGREVLVSGARVAGPDWLVFVEQPLDIVLSDVRLGAIRLGGMLAVALIVALLAARLLARAAVAPLLELTRGASEFGRGRFDARIRLSDDSEFQALASALNAMAERIQGHTEGLERAVAEKTRELALANEHKSEFLANVSHELRTPLNAVIGFSEALQAKLFGELNDKQLEYVNDIHGSGLHLLALINDLLDLSKVEAGRMELEVAPFDVRAALEASLSLVRERAQRTGVDLRGQFDPALGEWLGDARRVRQIVLNLLSNAIKFTRAGGAVRLTAGQTETMLTISVQDTGIGIAAQDLPRLFEPFRQLRVVDASRQEGTGLGLALTRKLVELHGGSICVQSEVGAGTTFTVTLPRAPAGAEPS